LRSRALDHLRQRVSHPSVAGTDRGVDESPADPAEDPAERLWRQQQGTRLHAALVAAGAPEKVQIVPVECLSACSQGCSVALSAPGRWSYVYGRMTENDAAEILSGAAAYANAPDGIVPWRERPTIFRKQSLARIPPMVLA
jgi:predicted metal-binding protein